MSGIKFLGGIVALLTSTSALAQAGEWRVSEASGRVVVRDAGGDKAVARGGVVPAGATLMTGPGARAVVVRGEDFVTVAPNSRLRVPTAAQATGLFQMISEWGSAVFRIKHLAKPHFAVQTPYLAAVVKGTTFSVTVTGEGASVQVTDGAVEVATVDGGAHELVRPGTVATVTAADRYRLSVQAQEARVIDSPARATAEAAAPAAAPSATPPARTDDDIAWSDVSEAIVAAPIEAKPVELAALTGGMVSGRAGAEVAALVAPAAAVPAVVEVAAARTDLTPAGVKAMPAAEAAPLADMTTGKETKQPTPTEDAKTVGVVVDEAAKDEKAEAKDGKAAEKADDKGLPVAGPKDDKPAPPAPKDDDKGPPAPGPKDDKPAPPAPKDDDKGPLAPGPKDDKPAPPAPKDDDKGPPAAGPKDDKDNSGPGSKDDDKAAKDAEKDAKKAADEAKKAADEAKKAAEEAAKDAEKAAKDAAKDADKADKPGKDDDKAGKDDGKSGKDDGKDADKPGKDSGKDDGPAGKGRKGKGLKDVVDDVLGHIS